MRKLVGMAASLTDRDGSTRRAHRPRLGTPVPPGSVTPETCALTTQLLTAVRALGAALRRHPARHTGGSRAATEAECRILRCLVDAPGALSLLELARRVHRDPSTVSVLTHRLAGRRLVRKERDPHDGRRLGIAVTREGRRAVREAPDVAREALSGVVATWTAGQARAATELVDGLTAALLADR